MKDHVGTIAQYIKENVGGRYILPPMTLNVQQKISVYVPKAILNGAFGAVYLVVPETARLSVTDGGHRTNAIIKAASEMSPDEAAKFDQDAVAAMITLESSVVQVHQDFADCSKTKPLPKSQLAAYDRRNPANGLVLDLIQKCKLFDDKIDSTSKTLSSLSTNLFLTNQVRQLVKELLFGDYALADDQFEVKAKELLGSSETSHYVELQDRYAEFIDLVTDTVPILAEIAPLPPGTPRNIIKERRAEGWICLTATGMVIIGRIGYELFRDRRPDWRDIAKRLGDIDWSRNGELWRNNIVRSGKMTTQRAPVRLAVENVRRAIGLPPNSKLDQDLAQAA
jgi:DGQHR domain-containing protein